MQTKSQQIKRETASKSPNKTAGRAATKGPVQQAKKQEEKKP